MICLLSLFLTCVCIWIRGWLKRLDRVLLVPLCLQRTAAPSTCVPSLTACDKRDLGIACPQPTPPPLAVFCFASINQSNWVKSPSCKPQIHSYAGVMCLMACQQASQGYREQALVGFDEGVLLPRWDSVSPIQSSKGGGRWARARRSFTGKTTRELRPALQQLLGLWSREGLDLQHLGSDQWTAQAPHQHVLFAVRVEA